MQTGATGEPQSARPDDPVMGPPTWNPESSVRYFVGSSTGVVAMVIDEGATQVDPG